MIPWLAQQYSLQGLDGEIYDDWYVPEWETVRVLLLNRDKLNRIFDELGGEPLPGSSYVYTTDPCIGQNAFGYGDGMSFGCSNMSTNPAHDLMGVRFHFMPDPMVSEATQWLTYTPNDPWWSFRLVRKF
jgi:hypothetical protein